MVVAGKKDGQVQDQISVALRAKYRQGRGLMSSLLAPLSAHTSATVARAVTTSKAYPYGPQAVFDIFQRASVRTLLGRWAARLNED